MLYDACCWVLASALWDMAAAAALVKNSKGSLPTDTAAQASGRGEGQRNKGKDSTAGGIAGARVEEQG